MEDIEKSLKLIDTIEIIIILCNERNDIILQMCEIYHFY